MRIFKEETVLEEALKRIERLFNEFDNVIVGFSGGKDSTVTLSLALTVARKLDRLPLKVLWVDQEAEWQATADYVESVFANPEIEPLWYQMPMKWNNNLSGETKHLTIWEEGKEWIREKSDISIKDNKYLDVGFNELFGKILQVDFKEVKSCYLAGVRTEEAPKRLVALTSGLTYQDITWGKVLTKGMHYTFYPIYDWSYTDVWKYIYDNNIPYNKIYDELYKKGVPFIEMRVSSVHHETSIKALLTVQEIEPKTWTKICKRHKGINTVKHLQQDFYKCPKELPYMFSDWKEYALYLAENLIEDKSNHEALIKKLGSYEYLDNEITGEKFWKTIINTVLSYDMDFTKLANFAMNGDIDTFRRMYKNPDNTAKNYKWIPSMLKSSRYLTTEQKLKVINYFKNGQDKK